MKALVFDKKLKFVENFKNPDVLPQEALIEVKMAGICNTDIEITKGYKGFTGIAGHEFTGIVRAVNSSDKTWIGRRVVGDINCACNRPDCYYCQKNLGRHCPERTTLGIKGRNGCFAEYITLPVENLLEVPDCVADEMAVFTEPLAAGFEILEQVDFTSDHEVLIVGDGKLGLLINHALGTTSARITHVGKHAEKLRLVAGSDCKTILLHEMPEKKYDVVVEATGSPEGFNFSVAHTKPRGKLVLKSTIASGHKTDMNPVVVNEITIIGSRCGLFAPALDYLASGVDLMPMISGIYPFEKALEAFEAAKQKGALKILIRF
jgi:threonine dehydrogenase-like Zn-dependent dehydrogenase